MSVLMNDLTAESIARREGESFRAWLTRMGATLDYREYVDAGVAEEAQARGVTQGEAEREFVEVASEYILRHGTLEAEHDYEQTGQQLMPICMVCPSNRRCRLVRDKIGLPRFGKPMPWAESSVRTSAES